MPIAPIYSDYTFIALMTQIQVIIQIHAKTVFTVLTNYYRTDNFGIFVTNCFDFVLFGFEGEKDCAMLAQVISVDFISLRLAY